MSHELVCELMLFLQTAQLTKDLVTDTVVLFGCETLSFILREEHRLSMIENRALIGIFWPKRDDNREWRRLHNVEHLI
jgi:hypothetical protein